MTPWKVPLEVNHPFSETELNYLLNLFDSPDCMVTRAEDGNYYLTTCRFETLTDYKEVSESAKKLTHDDCFC